MKQTSNIKNNEFEAPSTPATCERLPCRGCTRDCSLYAQCNGRPWRLPNTAKAAAGTNAQAHASSSSNPTSLSG